MLHWNGTQLVATADMPVDIEAIRTYSRANVVDGKFRYGTPSEKTIYTTALVSYDNPDNHYNTAVEAVNDLNLVHRWKAWAQAEMTAIGCTSRGEAQRKGKYAMITNSLNRVVTFKVGMEGYLPQPGDVIGVADQVLAGANFSGRIHASTIRTVTTDRDISAVAGDILYVNRADGRTGEGRTIQSVSGRTITVTADYSELPNVELGWYIEKTDLKSQLFRVMKISWAEEDGQFEIVAAQYEDSKYAAVDTGARIESRPITTIPAGGQEAPEEVLISSFTFLEQTMAVTTMSVKWAAVPGAMNYEAQWRKDGGDWLNVGFTAATGFDIKGIYSGDYQARVRAINAIGVKSIWTESANTPLTGKVGAPPALASFTTTPEVFAIRLNWTFNEGSDDGAFIQIQEADDEIGTNSTELGFQAYPTKTYLKSSMAAAVVRFFRARLIDRSGIQGPWTTWTYGISSADASEILDYLTGQITETELGESLLEEIELISGEGPGSVNNRIAASQALLQGEIDELQDQIDNFSDALEYDPTKTYILNDIVRVGQRLYQATQAVPINTSPPNATYWQDVGQVVQSVNGLALQVDANTTSISVIDGKVTSQATSLEALRAAYREDDGSGDLSDALKMWNNTAEIATERVVRASANEAFAQQITVIEASVADNTAQIATEQTVRATADEALATSITSLTATVDENTAAIVTEQTARADGDSALASSISIVQATADAKNKTYRQAAAPTGTLAIGDLWFDSDDGNKAYRWSGSAWVLTDDIRIAENAAAITAEQTARADADTALAQSITAVSAVANAKNKTFRQAAAPTNVPAGTLVDGDLWFDSDDGNKPYRWTGSSWVATDDTRIAANAAAITTEQTARADADSALADSITTVSATVAGKNKTYRQTTAPANSPVGTLVIGDTWIDTDDKNKRYNWNGSSWVLSDNTDIAANSSAIQVQATALADLDGDLSAMYSIKLGINSGGNYYAAGMGIGIENTPSGMQSQVLFVADRFAILNSINGVTVSPFIVQGGQTIINNAVIGNATIGFAKISDDIQSTNYVAGQTGWKLGKGGTLEFNGTVAGSGRLTINNNVIQVFDSAGTLRVRMGMW
jgi:predicted phage tail protein